MLSPETLGYAFLGGVLPALIWLYFLLKEDAKHPEPKHLIILAFIAGMIAVRLVIPIERAAAARLPDGFPTLLAWASAEEVLKYLGAALLVLWRWDVDEAPDYVIYLITVALGFAAAENALFLVAPIQSGHLITGLVTDNLRFIGSTLLHVTASAAIGFSLAFSFKKSAALRMLYAAAGLVLAVALHVSFNTLIISGDATKALTGFFLVWSASVVFFALFEILKYLQQKRAV